MSVIDIIALFAIISIWLLLFINVFLSIGGFIFYYKINKDTSVPKLKEFPFVSILVPAHNESVVIRKTVRALLNLDYPHDRLEVIVINDNSQDDSAQVLKGIQDKFSDRNLIVINTDNITGGKGKSNALNIGFSASKGSVIAVYDADNTPSPDALLRLVAELQKDDKAAVVIGKFRTRNRNVSLITRFVNIETLAYQCMNQAGRYFFFKLCTIPGTNYVIRRKIVEDIGAWDVKALSEDTEMSFRIYRMGYYIKFMPLAVTWEQEPSTLPIWFKQRTRWAKGNIYVLLKNFKYIFDPRAGAMRLDIIYYVLVYVLMLTSLVFSDLIFSFSMLGIVSISLKGFSMSLWGMAILAFVLNVLVTLAPEPGEFNLKSVFLILLMLFTYSKLWVVVVLFAGFKSFEDWVLKNETKWYKTERQVE